MRLTAEISHIILLINGTLSREVSSVRKPGDTSSEILMVFRFYRWYSNFNTEKADFREKCQKNSILLQQKKKVRILATGEPLPFII